MRYSLFKIFLLFYSFSFSQTTINGKIFDENNNPLQGSNIVVTKINEDIILSYDISDSNGYYSLIINSTLDSLQVEVSFIGYAKQSKIVSSKNQILNFNLLESSEKLKEIVIKNSPITKKGDTISYNVSSFANKKDRTIADVLSKMPGIEVLSDGKILYQGVPINKYYIEGLDLLEGNYNLANKNIPFDAVSKVQILENHQPVKVLDSLVYSDNAALNIKLKNNITLTGQTELGIGISPLLWENNITPMFFSKKKQMITSYQSNNTGNDVSSQLETLTLEDLIENFESGFNKKDLLGIQQLNIPDFSEKRWLDNNIHLISTNYLQKLKNDLELRFNISYLNDYQQQNGLTETLFLTQNDTIQIKEISYNRIFKNSLRTNLTIQKNTKNNYLKNSLQYQGYWDSQNGLTNLNNLLVNQNLKNNYFSISNKFKNIFSFGKQLLTLNSNINYNKTPQKLQIKPGQFISLINSNNFYDNLQQYVDLKKLYSNNYLSFTKGISKFSITPKIGFEFENQNLDTGIFIDNFEIDNNDFYNQLEWLKSKVYSVIQTQYKKGKWRIELNTSLNFNHIKIADKNLDKNEEINRLVFEPRLSIINDINSYWKLSGFVSVKNQFGSIEDIHYGYILKNYRNIQRINSIIPQSLTKNYNFGISYRNPIKSLFGNLTYSHSSSIDNLLLSSNIINNGSIELVAIEKENTKKNHIISGNISKYISKINTNFKLNISWSNIIFDQILNNELTQIINRNNNISLKSNTDILDWLDFEYQVKLDISKNQLQKQNNNSVTNQSHILSLNIYPKQNQYIGVKTEYIKNNLFASNNETIFADLVYRYTWKKKNIDFEIQYNNVFNMKYFQTINIDNFSYVETNFALRPAQILFKLRMPL